MRTQKITIDFPSDILLTLNASEKELEQNIKMSLAIRLYKLQKVTIGKASQIAGITRYEFEKLLSENEVPISNLSYDDVISDLNKLNK